MKSTMIPSELFQVSEIDLIYKSKYRASSRPKIKESKDAYEVFKKVWDENKIDFFEQFKILLLNRANMVLAVYHVSSGGITGTVADARLIFAAALKANAVGLVMAHNHPSGNLEPSMGDEDITQKIKQAGLYLNIKLIDHIIITSEGYLSFADKGLI